MAAQFQIRPVQTAADLAAVANLFAGYAASLPVDLSYQDFVSELAELPGRYAQPKGQLLIALDTDGAALGCVGLRAISSEGCCEMKRLFLLPPARGLGLGRAMTKAVIEEARRLGYVQLWLDTLPTMQAAISLYEQMGFKRIAAYYAPTPEGTIFMGLRL